ncbi:acyl carrier protein [Coxiella burnetii]|uniref:Acyl carrier protein n=2 Tax=Coxiella burnetii TaxID=777 RepID=Q83FA8_COXBU|nr:acyl carrier protein [Coxiella burnetii]NP_819089.1 acyl carrier protein [Coxiella burnetii RSA 493]AAO89603.1 acyl carrier protein [Coxiella burnetii RSA 493]ABS78282.1 acyl carrier protein [Coxiella burnetii Dugway 5J108-111]ABX79140.1 putative acyl carrier protein [Coxiella burnetii RSA 331]ACJ19536.1 acyl carrier protein [Coxiella burnetii CbuK_Q154]AIT62564.1 Acyl carrier protein [Coxiella burnetii str. Namibia]
MDKVEIFNKIKTIITPFSKAPDAVAQATYASRFLEDLQINSARLIDIVLAFEDTFNIEISDDQADSILTIEDAVNLISSQVKTVAV